MAIDFTNKTNVRGETPGAPPPSVADGLKLPASGGNVPFKNADGATVARVLATVPGISPNNGRDANAQAYLDYINRVGAAGAAAAIANWLIEN